MGPSGCGKSTLLRAINRMHELYPDIRISGEILMDNRNILKMNPMEVRRMAGMVFQRPNPFPTMSIFDNVIAGYKLNGIRLKKKEKEEQRKKEEEKKRKEEAEKERIRKEEAEKKAAAPAEESTVDFTHEEEIDFDTFCKVELRVAEVRACENLKESKKLLHLTVFDGERERCILSGIAKWFAPEDLIGKKIGIVANLAPRPMMKGKYVSEGMIFAADTDVDGGCSIAFFPDSTPAGARIH